MKTLARALDVIYVLWLLFLAVSGLVGMATHDGDTALIYLLVLLAAIGLLELSSIRAKLEEKPKHIVLKVNDADIDRINEAMRGAGGAR